VVGGVLCGEKLYKGPRLGAIVSTVESRGKTSVLGVGSRGDFDDSDGSFWDSGIKWA